MAEDDRRQHTRFPIRLQTEIQFTNWEVFRLIYSINISQGGMNLELPQDCKIGERIRVLLRLPGTPNPVELEATVRHSQSMFRPQTGTPDPDKPAPPPRFAVGIQFDTLDGPKKQAIEKLIESHTQGPLPTLQRRQS